MTPDFSPSQTYALSVHSGLVYQYFQIADFAYRGIFGLALSGFQVAKRTSRREGSKALPLALAL